MEKKVTIILLHYNQPNYVKVALDSIFEQTYEDIELIFADDASTKIDIKDLKKYCDKQNKKNIDIIWQINKDNIGTVKNINRALARSTGEYILLFAADDKLYDKDVIKKLVKSIEKSDKDVCMISSQCYMMDKNLEKLKEEFVDEQMAEKFNQLSSFEQFKYLSTTCFFAMGSTIIKCSILKKECMFDEQYKYVEDWSSFIALTRKGYRILYDNSIIGLLHRDGGISHSEIYTEVPKHIMGFREDLVKIKINEVLPYFKSFRTKEKYKIIENFNADKNNLIKSGGHFNKLFYFKFKIKNINFFLRKKLNYYIINHSSIKKKYINNCPKISIFILLLIELNKYFNKQYNNIFNILINLLLLALLLNVFALLFNTLLYISYSIKNIIVDRRK